MQSYVHPIKCALAGVEDEMPVYTRAQGTMAHSLVQFEGIAATSESTIQTRRLDSVFKELGLDYIDVLHVSVNGFEREVLDGLGDYAHKIGVYRVTAPYKVAGKNVASNVMEYFEEQGIKIHGKSQAAIIAGPEGVNYNFR